MEDAELRLQCSGLSNQFSAAIYSALGKVAKGWHQYDRATNWLHHAEAIWRELDKDPKFRSSQKAPMQRELARSLDDLAWAELGDRQQTNGLRERALKAAAAAREAYEIRKNVDGETNDATLCDYGDWLRMRFYASGDVLSLVKGYVGELATAMGQEEEAVVKVMGQSLKDTANLALANKPEQARAQVWKFLAPLVAENRPDFRRRMPYALAQVAEESGQPGWGFILGRIFELSGGEIAAVRLPLAEVALEMTQWNQVDRPKVTTILAKIRQ